MTNEEILREIGYKPKKPETIPESLPINYAEEWLKRSRSYHKLCDIAAAFSEEG